MFMSQYHSYIILQDAGNIFAGIVECRVLSVNHVHIDDMRKSVTYVLCLYT